MLSVGIALSANMTRRPEMTCLITDESLDTRLASSLRRRGRDSVSVASLGYRGHEDPTLIRKIIKDHPEAVLITADDKMPADHPEALMETGIPVATIDPDRPDGLTEEEWRWETIHRWAHRIAIQPRGTWRRYGHFVRPWESRPHGQSVKGLRRSVPAYRNRVSIRTRGIRVDLPLRCGTSGHECRSAGQRKRAAMEP
jgi:hypothetical protein